MDAGYWLFICLLLTFGSSDVTGIRCYECGTGDDNARPCDHFLNSPLWRPYEVECPSSPEHVCVKTITDDPDGQRNAVRSCSPATTALNVPHQMGCGRPSVNSETVICLCDTHLCNASPDQPSSKSGSFLLLALLLATFVTLSSGWNL